MPKVVLETDILSEHLKGHDQAVARRAATNAQQYKVFTFTSVIVHEIVFGLEFKNASAQLLKALAWLNRNEPVTPTAVDFVAEASIKAKARKQGVILELPDCLIAAVAIRLGIPFVTGNMNDIQAIQKTGAKLILENWRIS